MQCVQLSLVPLAMIIVFSYGDNCSRSCFAFADVAAAGTAASSSFLYIYSGRRKSNRIRATKKHPMRLAVNQ